MTVPMIEIKRGVEGWVIEVPGESIPWSDGRTGKMQLSTIYEDDWTFTVEGDDKFGSISVSLTRVKR